MLEFNKKPAIYNQALKFGELTLYLDINSKDKINDIGFECHHSASLPAEILNGYNDGCANIIKKSISSLRTIIQTQVDSPEKSSLSWQFKLHLNMSIKQFCASNDDQIDDLICRCKGVGKSNITSSCQENLSLVLSQVSKSTNACTGCGTCKKDIAEILIRSRLKSEKLENHCRNINLKELGVRPAELLISIYENLQEYFEMTNQTCRFEVSAQDNNIFTLQFFDFKNLKVSELLIKANVYLEERLQIPVLLKHLDESY